ncbi:GroES family chaperonin [Thalassobellus suaedae]|uniref:GroES family chaperonin n=1 Tax=Thalassobellus suaedae TaxID=3074124 RepID=UPI0039F61B48
MKPLGHRVLVRPIKETKTKGGIIIPESGVKNNKGEVVFTGTKVDYIQVGAQVIYHEHSGTHVPHEGEDFLMLGCGEKNSELIAVL